MEDNGQTPTLKDIAAEELASRTLTIGDDARTAFTWLNLLLVDRQRAAGTRPPNTVHVQAALELAGVAPALRRADALPLRVVPHRRRPRGRGRPRGRRYCPGNMRITKKDPATGDVIWAQGYWATFGQVSRGWAGA